MQLQFASRKIDGKYEAAVFTDAKFQRSGTGQSLTELFRRLADPYLEQQDEEGGEVIVVITLNSADEVTRAEAREQRLRKTAEADAEAAEIEKFNAARKREEDARGAQA